MGVGILGIETSPEAEGIETSSRESDERIDNEAADPAGWLRHAAAHRDADPDPWMPGRTLCHSAIRLGKT